MLISYILAAHIILATAVVTGFAYRFVEAIKQKDYSSRGRKSVIIGSLLLLISGISLSVMGHLSISAVCINSLVLIALLTAGELGILKVASLAREKSKNR